MGWLHFAASGHAVQFYPHPRNPQQCVPSVVWFSVESPTSVRIRPKRNDEGWTQDYQFEEGRLVLSGGGNRWICTRADAAELPEWLRQALESLPPKLSNRLPGA